jgi:raffinose/stachyose/melibiose transport system substrate-binding protein
MKKLLASAIAAALFALALTGCGNSGKSAGNSSPASGGTISYLTWDYSDRKASTDAFIQTVKSKYNITIDMQNIPTDQYAAVLKTKVSANDLPDLVHVHAINSDYTDPGDKCTFDANTFADITGLTSVADYDSTVTDSLKIDSKLFYVPVSRNVLGVIYNKKAFSDSGITATPKNLDEFTADMKKIRGKGITPIAFGAKDSWATQIIPFIAFSQYIDGKDATIRQNLATGKKKYADIKTDLVKTLSVQDGWNKDGYFQKDCLGSDINVASQLVGTEKAAMLICGTWQYTTVQQADSSASIGFFALPLNAAGEKVQVPTNANEGICISASSKSLDLAKQSLDYYLSTNNQTLIIKDLNGISTNSKVTSSSAFVQEVQNTLKDSNNNVQPVWWGCNGLYYPGATTFQIDVQIQSLLAGVTTYDKFISDFDTADAAALKG